MKPSICFIGDDYAFSRLSDFCTVRKLNPDEVEYFFDQVQTDAIVITPLASLNSGSLWPSTSRLADLRDHAGYGAIFKEASRLQIPVIAWLHNEPTDSERHTSLARCADLVLSPSSSSVKKWSSFGFEARYLEGLGVSPLRAINNGGRGLVDEVRAYQGYDLADSKVSFGVDRSHSALKAGVNYLQASKRRWTRYPFYPYDTKQELARLRHSGEVDVPRIVSIFEDGDFNNYFQFFDDILGGSTPLVLAPQKKDRDGVSQRFSRIFRQVPLASAPTNAKIDHDSEIVRIAESRKWHYWTQVVSRGLLSDGFMKAIRGFVPQRLFGLTFVVEMEGEVKEPRAILSECLRVVDEDTQIFTSNSAGELTQYCESSGKLHVRELPKQTTVDEIAQSRPRVNIQGCENLVNSVNLARKLAVHVNTGEARDLPVLSDELGLAWKKVSFNFSGVE